MATLNCAMIEDDNFVIESIEASNAEKPNETNCDADQLMLPLAKRDGSLFKDSGLDELAGVDLVEAPTSAMQVAPTQRQASQVSLAIRNKRQEQWDALSARFLQAASKSGRKHKSGRKKRKRCYSYNDSVNLGLIRQVYGPFVPFEQPVKEVPQETLASILTLLAGKTKVLGAFWLGGNTQRLLFFEPIIMHIVDLFRHESLPVHIALQVELNMDNFSVNVDFLMDRGRKRICIMQAKKDDMDKAMAQAIVGMEFALGLDEVTAVYGIVTNYWDWTFLEISDDAIKRDWDSLSFELGFPTEVSMKRIAGKIYSILSSDV